jgi:hypothetical protein
MLVVVCQAASPADRLAYVQPMPSELLGRVGDVALELALGDLAV